MHNDISLLIYTFQRCHGGFVYTGCIWPGWERYFREAEWPQQDVCGYMWVFMRTNQTPRSFPVASAKYLIPCQKQFCKSALIGVYVDIDFWRDWGCFWPCLGSKAGKNCKTWSFWIQKYIWKLKFSFANLVPRKHPQIDGFINHFMIKFGRQRFWVYFPPGRLSRLLTSNRDEINNFAKTHWASVHSINLVKGPTLPSALRDNPDYPERN